MKKICFSGGSSEIVEKKSRFIADVFAVKNETDVYANIDLVKKKYYDARHHCYGFVLSSGTQKCSDDGEPSQTAGRPILDVINGEGIVDVLVVVTRYFGGTLLGTGGLVRAYSSAAKSGIESSTILEVHAGIKCELVMDYAFYNSFIGYVNANDIKVVDSSFLETVSMTIIIPYEKLETVEDKITTLSLGRIELTNKKPISYVLLDGNTIEC